MKLYKEVYRNSKTIYLKNIITGKTKNKENCYHPNLTEIKGKWYCDKCKEKIVI